MSSVSVVEAGVGESTLVPVPGRVLSEYTQGDFKLTMWIPSDYAGRVIGKKGAVITNLLRETRAKQINAMQPVGRSLWLPVVISGEYRHALAAYDAIAEIVEGEVDDVVLEFQINPRKPFFLYGPRKSAIIAETSAGSGARLFFPDTRQNKANPALEGGCESVKKAVLLLEIEAVKYQAQNA
eukprot:CAMPEP_0173274048 /NCGR_PEP_ID=MMETSP1143-20121109/2235_1 /TAXON_ID=483371 /ORGANISM="non described non described, Strain CCMP2298" /LENGTH=181 /DNA_ID=CAMNT_0014210839 /DNA_START=39 /DNA_END=581 /DNA_ORIENTATION=-